MSDRSIETEVLRDADVERLEVLRDKRCQETAML